ncbi:MAG TPA: FmdB family zinc ribbon protein [Gemmatimonadaceae bacterium]|nr:FmdB family zinc ribbon protein [Gemmatimonadaceae bacterium]
MPTYEFRCPNKHDFDRFYKTISTAPLQVPCPECGAIAARQLSGGGGLVFKGSGFYLTDYGKNAHRKPDTSKSDSKADNAKSESSKAAGESAPAKSETKAESSTPRTETKPAAQPSKPPKPQSE